MRRVAVAAVLACAMSVPLIPAITSHAAAISVSTTADGIDAAADCPSVTIASLPGPDGQTSLREAVCAANSNAGADVISFSVNGTFVLTGAVNEDNGTSGDLDIKQSLAVNGNGVANTIIDGGAIERIFDVFPSAASTFDLTDLTVQNGDTRLTSFKEGGAIYLHNNVTTTLTGVRVANNFAGANGAIENRGILTISNSTITGNQTIPSSGSVVGGGLHNAGTLTISNTTISNNTVRGEGGGIATTSGAAVTVTITNTTISGNTASVTGGGLGNGGGISTTGNQGTINVTNSTISGNHADNDGGGGRWVTPAGGTGNVTLNNVTMSDNIADNDNNGAGAGGGFAQSTAAVTLRNTIVAGNFNSIVSVRDDISGAVLGSSHNNLIGDGTGSSGITNGVNNNQVGSGATPVDPLLGPLADNTGLTATHALLVGSPAINAGNNATCAPTDQRGIARPAGVACDIGSYELADVTPPDTTITSTPPNPSASSDAAFTFDGSDTGGSGLAGFQCEIDGGGFSPCTSPQNYTGLGNGNHTFNVRAIDGLGNVDPTPDSYTWLVNISTPPDLTINTAATQSDPTSVSPIDFTVVFSEPVTGFATGDVTLFGTAGATTAIVSETAPNDGTTYNVAVSGMTTSGTVVAVVPAGVATDTDGNPNNASTSIDNTVTYNVVVPDVTINTAATQSDPTSVSPIDFTVVFSEPVTGFATGDVTLFGTAGATTAIVSETAPNDGTTYNVAVSGMTTSGTVVAVVPAGVATDTDGNPNNASTSIDNTVTYNVVVPDVTIDTAATQSDPTSVSPIDFTVVFSEPVTGFATGDVTLFGTAGATTAIVSETAPNDGTTYNVAVSGMTTSGTVVAVVPAGVATDTDGNPNNASTSIDNTVTYQAPPTATVTNGQCAGVNTAGGTINLTLADPDGGALTLTLASNSNTALVPNGNIVVGGSGNSRTVTATAAAKKSGTATLTFNVSDGTTTIPVVVTVRVGTDKNETLNGTSGIDMIFGLGGANTINGNAGNDLLCGGNSTDTISGGDGNDILDGQNGNDGLNGGNGDDILRGSLGNDTLTGGANADTFSGGAGTDIATDLDAGQGDIQDATIP